jgi:hypothetical protein
LAPAAAPLALAGVLFSPAGLADGDLFRLKKFGNRNLNLPGVAVGRGVGVALGETAAVVLLRLRFGFGKAARDSTSEGDVALSTGGVASVLFCVPCFDGEKDSGVSSCD